MVARYRLKRAIEDLLEETVALQVAVDRHSAPGFRQTVDGVAIDREAFIVGSDHCGRS